MIIVEGMDNAGKTRLVSDLLKLDPRLHLVKRERFKPGVNENIAETYMQILDGPTEWAIVDRFFMSECIYGTLYREGCRIPPAVHERLIARLMQIGAMVVHVHPPLDVVLKTWNNRPQLYPDDPSSLWKQYDHWMPIMCQRLAYWRFDWSAHSGTRRELASILNHHARSHRQESL